MWKKVVPAVALSSLLLVGCNNRDNTVPNNNETPMQDVRDDVNTLSPNRNNGMNDNGNGTLNDGNNGTMDNGVNDNGTINQGVNDNGTINNGTVPNDSNWMKEPEVNIKNDEIINDKNNNK